jgi:hypothetical protein
MSVDVDAMVKDGIRAYKAGKKDEACALWEKVTEIDQYNEQAWLWLSAVVESEDDQRTCLENVLFINADNASAKKGLAMLEAKTSQPPPAPRSAPAPEPPAEELYVPPPTATSSASSVFSPRDEPSSDDYDNWLESLNLNKTEETSTRKGTGPFTADSDFFDDDAFSSDIDFGIDDASGAFAAYQDDYVTADDDVDPFEDPFAPSSNAYGGAAAGPFAAPDLAEDDDDDIFSSRLRNTFGDDEEEPAPRRTSPASPVSSPVPTGGSGAYLSTDLFSSAAAFGGDAGDDQDPGEFFKLIPESIRATRLPGMAEKPSPLLLIGLLLLIVLNIGAVVLLVSQLPG